MKENNRGKKQKKKAIVVARTATKGPNSGLTLKSQLNWARNKAEELGAEIVYTFSFSGMSAHRFFETYAGQILDNIRNQKIEYLLVCRLDRLTRNLAQGIDILNKILELGCAIVTSSEIIDNATDMLLPHIEFAISEHTRKIKMERRRRGTPKSHHQEKTKDEMHNSHKDQYPNKGARIWK